MAYVALQVSGLVERSLLKSFLALSRPTRTQHSVLQLNDGLTSSFLAVGNPVHALCPCALFFLSCIDPWIQNLVGRDSVLVYFLEDSLQFLD